MAHSFTLIVFLPENELFERDWGSLSHVWKFRRGGGGHQLPAKMENPGGWGGPWWGSGYFLELHNTT